MHRPHLHNQISTTDWLNVLLQTNIHSQSLELCSPLVDIQLQKGPCVAFIICNACFPVSGETASIWNSAQTELRTENIPLPRKTPLVTEPRPLPLSPTSRGVSQTDKISRAAGECNISSRWLRWDKISPQNRIHVLILRAAADRLIVLKISISLSKLETSTSALSRHKIHKLFDYLFECSHLVWFHFNVLTQKPQTYWPWVQVC